MRINFALYPTVARVLASEDALSLQAPAPSNGPNSLTLEVPLDGGAVDGMSADEPSMKRFVLAFKKNGLEPLSSLLDQGVMTLNFPKNDQTKEIIKKVMNGFGVYEYTIK